MMNTSVTVTEGGVTVRHNYTITVRRMSTRYTAIRSTGDSTARGRNKQETQLTVTTVRRIGANAMTWLQTSQKRSSPYVLRCRIWSFCVKGCEHKYRRTPKVGESWNSAVLGWEPWLTQDIRLSPTGVTTSNLLFWDNGCTHKYKGAPKFRSAWAQPPCGWGVGDPIHVILPNLVVLGQTLRALLRRSA